MDDFENPEEEFPGLYTPGTSKGKKEEAEFSESGKKKDKKDKKDKDKGYATLAAGDSSPDEDGDTKSPSKTTKRIKAFKFPLKKEKEKREKSRDKDRVEVKDKAEKRKEKDLEKKKAKPSVTAEDPPLELGDVQPIFGVSLGLAVERSRCHDQSLLPIVVRDCIDYLQESQDLINESVYKGEPIKSKLQHLKKLYNNRESNGFADLDVQSAAGLLKMFLKELPEPILTTDLISQFEEVSAISDVQVQERQLKGLVEQLPKVNQALLKWVALHLDAVTEREKVHKMNAQILAMLLSPTLQMSHRLFVTILCHCRSLFPSAVGSQSLLPRYIPPLAGANPTLPEDRDGIMEELRKQESLLSQIHSEMNSGFVTKRREEQLWEVQRIITQLKRKLRQFERKPDGQKSIEDSVDSVPNEPAAGKIKSSDEDIGTRETIEVTAEISSPKDDQIPPGSTLYTITDNGFLALPPDHPEHDNFIQLQLENYELLKWRQQLQSAINHERAEIHSIKKKLKELNCDPIEPESIKVDTPTESELEEVFNENAYLHSVHAMLTEEIMKESQRIVEIRVQLGLSEILGN